MATCFLSLEKLLTKRAPISHLKPPNFKLPSQNPTPHLLLSAPNLFTSTRNSSHGLVNLVLSDLKPRFEDEPKKKKKWQSKTRLKEQRKGEKRKWREVNKRDPRRISPKGKKIKQKFATAEERIKYKTEKAKRKEALLVEKLKQYEVPKVQGPMPKREDLTGEECSYVKKMPQKRSNYVPVGRRGIFGGVILNMLLHWEKHETV